MTTEKMGPALKNAMNTINALGLEAASETRTLNLQSEVNKQKINKDLAEMERIKAKPEAERSQAEIDWYILKKPINELTKEETKAKGKLLEEQKEKQIMRKTVSEAMSTEDFLKYMKVQEEARQKIRELFEGKKIGEEQKSFSDRLWTEYPEDFDPEEYDKDEWIDYTGEGKIDRQVGCDGMTTYT